MAVAQERPPVDPLANATPAPKAQEQAPQRRPFGQGPQNGPRRPMAGGGLVDPEKAREALRNMAPEERQNWLRRFREFADLPPERLQELKNRQEMFRRKMREDVDAAIAATGMKFDDEQRRRFTERYAEERRKIEEDLRQQMEALRKPRVDALIEKLKGEFSGKTQ
jgi:hypothetical protein